LHGLYEQTPQINRVCTYRIRYEVNNKKRGSTGRVSQICSSSTPFFHFPVLTGFGGATATDEKIVGSMVKGLRSAVKVFKAVSFILKFIYFLFCLFAFLRLDHVGICCLSGAKKRKRELFCMSSFFFFNTLSLHYRQLASGNKCLSLSLPATPWRHRAMHFLLPNRFFSFLIY
jgi:hypothetical protein